MVWNQVKVPRHNLNIFCLEIVCKYMYFFKVKILFSTDGSIVQLQTGMCRFTKWNHICTKITYYFILWSDTEIGKILWIKTWILQKKTVWPKSIKTKLWQLESLVNRYVFPFVMFMISTYCDSMNSWLIVVFFCYEKSRIIQLWCLEIKKEFL